MFEEKSQKPENIQPSLPAHTPGRSAGGYRTEHSLTPSHLPTVSHFASVAYTGARVLETTVLGLGGFGLAVGMGLAEMGEAQRIKTAHALGRYPFSNTEIHFKSGVSCHCLGVDHIESALDRDSRLLSTLLKNSDVVLLGGKINDKLLSAMRTIALKSNTPLVDIDPFSPAREGFAEQVTKFSPPIAALLLLLGNLREPQFPTIGAKRKPSIARFSRRGFLRACGYLSLAVATPSAPQVKATIDNEPYPKTDIGFTVDGRTALIADQIERYLAKNPTKRVSVIAPEPWAAGIVHYSGNPEALSWRVNIYKHIYAALLGK